MERRGVRRTLGSWSLGDDGVFKRPDANEEEFEDGWLKTGDVVTVDPDGYVQIVDRAKDVIKSGGEWISSQELENVIMAHDDVSEAIVVGVSHKKWQERPMAFVVPREGADRETIEADIADMLAEDYPEAFILLFSRPSRDVYSMYNPTTAPNGRAVGTDGWVGPRGPSTGITDLPDDPPGW